MPSKIINVAGFNVPDDVRKSIKMIVDQMQHHNFAVINSFNAVRIFSLYLPDIYKRDGTVIITRNKKLSKSIVTLNPDFRVDKIDDFSFKIVLKPRK